MARNRWMVRDRITCEPVTNKLFKSCKAAIRYMNEFERAAGCTVDYILEEQLPPMPVKTGGNRLKQRPCTLGAFI